MSMFYLTRMNFGTLINTLRQCQHISPRCSTLPGEPCTICLEMPSSGEMVTTLPCCHWYHTECIRATLTQKISDTPQTGGNQELLQGASSWVTHGESYVNMLGLCQALVNFKLRNGCYMQGCAPCAKLP